jgi:hypothetical protein
LGGDRVTAASAERRTLTIEHFAQPEDFRDYFKARYGPTIAVYRGIAADAERTAALDRVWRTWPAATTAAAAGQ